MVHKTSLTRAIVVLFSTLLLLAGVSATAYAEDYRVKQGDTLGDIASDHNTTAKRIYNLNDHKISDPDMIYPGQVFTVTAKVKEKKPKPPSKVMPSTGRITSSYGMREHPITGANRMHTGTDFAVGNGKARAAKAGKVVGAYWASGYGRLVVISHSNGIQTRYAHLGGFGVDVGDRVKVGERIGPIGASGNVTGAHLHFEVLKHGEFINPMGWLN